MTLPEEPQIEEMTIGESGGRWRRPLAVVTAAVLVVALVAGGVVAYRASREPSPPPDGPWPRTGIFLVHLCGPPSPYDAQLSDESQSLDEYCPSGAATASQRREVERVLASHAETRDTGDSRRRRPSPSPARTNASATEDAEHALAVMRHVQWVDRPEFYHADLMPEAFHVMFAGPWDFAQVQRAFAGMPGVVKVVRHGHP